MTDDLDLARALARAPRTRVAIVRCPCGWQARIRAGRDLTPEERAASAWRPQHGPCAWSRPFLTIHDIVEEREA